MAKVTLYTTMFCPYCHRAKSLLEQKGIAYEEIDVGFDAGLRREMSEKTGGRRTVPQIFLGDTHIGGSEELHDLERQGRLDAMLAPA